MEEVLNQARLARRAARGLARASSQTKTAALNGAAASLEARSAEIIEANQADCAAGETAGLSRALIDRLRLDDVRIKAMADGVRSVAALPDPVGRVIGGSRLANGLDVQRVRVPFGVIGVIYESRPNVTVDAAALAVKSGNAVILRGGKEAIRSNRLLASIMQEAVAAGGLPDGVVQAVQSPDREAALALMRAEGLVDLLIPRGGNALKKSVLENATIPVLTSLGGNCHVYVEESAELRMASDIIFNAKVSRPSVCNAAETLLVDESIADKFLPSVCRRLQEACVEIRGDAAVVALAPGAKPAAEADWETEYSDLILAVKVVAGIEEAIDHIEKYGSSHSEAIVTGRYDAAERFTREIDAACVYVNASTRFTDGFEFGMGAEVGISTQKLHARGPIGLEELTTYKTIVRGSGQIRI